MTAVSYSTIRTADTAKRPTFDPTLPDLYTEAGNDAWGKALLTYVSALVTAQDATSRAPGEVNAKVVKRYGYFANTPAALAQRSAEAVEHYNHCRHVLLMTPATSLLNISGKLALLGEALGLQPSTEVFRALDHIRTNIEAAQIHAEDAERRRNKRPARRQLPATR